MVFRRSVQLFSFACFLVLLGFTAFPLVLPVPVDLFLRLDPAVFVSTLIATRGVIPSMLAAGALLGLTVVFGRFFCSMVCPLGATIAAADRLVRIMPFQRCIRIRSLRVMKYFLLGFMAGASLLGVTFAFLLAPIPFAERLYGLIAQPLVSRALNGGLHLIRPLAEKIGAEGLAYADFSLRAFSYQWLTLAFFAFLLMGSLLAPRFWCRYLCPAGAILAVASLRPFRRRRVGEGCTSCGLCSRKCPMDAIGEDPTATRHSECIQCRGCAEVCPAGAVGFSTVNRNEQEERPVSLNRRFIVVSGLSGAAAGLLALTGMKGFAAAGRDGKHGSVRPPAAVPEQEFLARCTGCGACMKVCPTNTLQPAGPASGLAGFMSPELRPRRGPCEPTCTACGQVCPTGALRPLAAEEKRYAKMGTASIDRTRCIAWKDGSACLVCFEVCPYGAVDLGRAGGSQTAVPSVDRKKCNGCGFCENYCPIPGEAAIRVGPQDALRLSSGSYRLKGRELGLSIEPGPGTEEGKGDFGKGLPPGFTE
jgi:MauM/NapG family ferredoxin protein